VSVRDNHPRPDWRQSLKIVAWYWRFYWCSIGWVGFYRLIRDLFQAVSPLLYAFFFARILDLLVAAVKYQLSLDVFLTQARFWLLAYGLIWLVDVLLNFDNWFFGNLLTEERFRLLFRQAFINHFSRLDYARLENAKTQGLIIKAWEQGPWPAYALTEQLWKGLINLVGFIVYFIWAVVFGLPFRFIALISGAALLRSMVLIIKSRIGFRIYDRTTKKSIVLWRLYDFFTKFNIILESKLSQADQYLSQKYQTITQRIFQWRVKAFLPWVGATLILDLIILAAKLIAYWWLMGQFLLRRFSVGDLTFGVNLIFRFHNALLETIWRLHEAINGLMYAQYFYRFQQLRPVLHCGSKRLELTEPPEIRLERVWFRYDPDQDWVLRDLSLVIKPREDLAIVGENGAGKTTLIKLILHLYEPQRGRILINGLDIREVKQEDLLRLIRVIPQDFARYQVLTVAENIGISDWHRLEDEERLWQAAKLAEAKEFIERLPNKLATPLSKELEGGVELSTGQWQKLALARLFFNPGQILVLDEPTASIDPVSEYRIFSNIYEQIKDKTVIIISHRYQTIRSAKRIVVIKNGRIIEEGSHRQLLAKNGYYASAWKMQQRGKLEK